MAALYGPAFSRWSRISPDRRRAHALDGEPVATPTRITDLMSVLEASLEQARAARTGAAASAEKAAEPASIAGGRRRRKAEAVAEPVAAADAEARPARRRKTA